MNKKTNPKNLAHHFLLASPQMDDERFEDTLIYVCRHNADGAWGFIVNQPLSISVGGLLHELDLPSSQIAMNTPAINGGPMRPDAGFVLHTGLPDFKSSFAIGENVCLTTSKDILQAIAHNEGVGHYQLLLGHASWGPGHLEYELREGAWLTCPADLGLLFEQPYALRWESAAAKIGVKLDRLVDEIGHA